MIYDDLDRNMTLCYADDDFNLVNIVIIRVSV